MDGLDRDGTEPFRISTPSRFVGRGYGFQFAAFLRQPSKGGEE